MNQSKLKILKISVIALFFNYSILAFAQTAPFGLFVEPLLTYELGKSAANFPSPLTNSNGSVNGFGIGAKIGFHLYDAFFIAADARYSKPHFLDSSVNYDAYSNAMNWGLMAGIQVPTIGMRAWAGPIIGAELNPNESGNFDIKMKNGTGFRIGTGFHVNQVSLNVEYQEIKYKEVLLEKIGPFRQTPI